MGRYSGDYTQHNFVDIPIIPRVLFTEGIIHSITFNADSVIDSGADLSNLPESIVRQFNIPARDWEDVFWPDNTIQRRPVYLLKAEVPHLRPITERFIDYGFPEVIIGRNLLNRWRIVLDPSHINSQHGIQIQDI